MARELGVCAAQAYVLGRTGVLPLLYYGNDERCLYAPLNGATLVNGVGDDSGTVVEALDPAVMLGIGDDRTLHTVATDARQRLVTALATLGQES